MSEFKTQSGISIIGINAIELKIIPEEYGIVDVIEEPLHIISGEFMYCDLVVDVKLILTEIQFRKIAGNENSSISDKRRNEFNASNRIQCVYLTEYDFLLFDGSVK